MLRLQVEWAIPEKISIDGTIITKILCGPNYVVILTNKGLWLLDITSFGSSHMVNYLNGTRDPNNPKLKKIDFDYMSIIDMKSSLIYIIILTDNGDVFINNGPVFIKIEITFINPKIFSGSYHCYILHDVLGKKCITELYRDKMTDTELDFDVETLVIEDGHRIIFYVGENSVYCKGVNIYYNLGLGHVDTVLEPISHPFLSGKNLLGFPNRNNVKRAN